MKIALIAHDGKKADMVSFVMKRLPFFQREDVAIVATGTTGKMITHAGVTKVERVASGPMGGDAEIGAMVTRGTPFPRSPNPYVLKKIYTCEHNVHKLLTKKCAGGFGDPRDRSYIYGIKK
jgi:hypothetical protein